MARLFNDITPLRVRSGYSLLRGTTRIAALIREAKKLGHSRIALTDVNSLHGATAFWRRAVDAGLTPLLGAELRDPAGRSVTAMVNSDAGYENLCQSITELRAMELEPEPVAASSPAPAAVTAGVGWARRDATGMLPRPVSPLASVLERFGEGLELLCDDAELIVDLLAAGVDRDGLHPAIDPASQSRRQLDALRALVEERNLPPVASAPSLTLGARHAEAARLLAAIRLRTTMNRVPDDQLPHPRAHLRDPDTLGRQLADWPDAIEGNTRLVQRCSRFRLLPREPVFPAFPTPDGSSSADFLRKLCSEGIARRYGDFPSGAVHARLERELGLIEQLGFVEYFLVVWDIVQYARRRGAPVAGRGSGGSSIVAYLLGITNVCPLRYDIPFERFIHARREDFPDLDVDFCWRLRDEVIEYAFDRWGRDCTAMVSMHTTFQPRSAFRQAGKALGFSDQQLSRLSGRGPGRAGADQPDLSRITRLARSIRELPHVLSVHPGGIVIAPRGIRRYVPIERAAKGVMITQMDKDGVEDMRLVKLDLLGNRNLSTVRYACDRITERHGSAPDIEALPPADPATIERLRRGDTVGCNQLESPAMRHLLTMMQPSDVGDVMKALALIRPGAASIGMKEVFIRRLRGLEDTPPAPPQLAGVLRDTHGVMLYEDDVMLTAAAMLSCSLPQADRFRKRVQKCTSDAQRRELSREFLAGCVRNGIDPTYAKDTWVQMAKFNHYSFCRAHAGSYAMLAYAGAYLRTHWPREFWLAALNNNQSMYHPRVYVEQAKREGVTFRLPSVNHSGEEFVLEADGAIRVGLGFVSGLGPVTIERILEQRQRRAFDGLTDLLSRVGLGESEARSLILCGALDWTGRSRPTLMMEWTLHQTLKPGRVPGGPLLSAAPVVPDAPGDYDEARKYFDEREILGISVREHILSLYRPTLARLVTADTRALPHRVGQRVRIAGVLEATRATRTRNGETMLFLTLEDEHGMFEATVFPSAMGRMRTKLAGPGPYRITGRVDSQHGCVSVTAETVERIRVSGVDPR
ncbi:MAG: DNA polymerase III subunit alpha [Phycisphaerae bacterium]